MWGNMKQLDLSLQVIWAEAHKFSEKDKKENCNKAWRKSHGNLITSAIKNLSQNIIIKDAHFGGIDRIPFTQNNHSVFAT